MKPRTLTASFVIAAAALVMMARGSAQQQAPSYRDVAVDAAKWIRQSRLQTTFGWAWPADPRDPKTVSTSLYSGSPGVVLFLLELNSATGDPGYLAEAKKGADELMTKIP